MWFLKVRSWCLSVMILSFILVTKHQPTITLKSSGAISRFSVVLMRGWWWRQTSSWNVDFNLILTCLIAWEDIGVFICREIFKSNVHFAYSEFTSSLISSLKWPIHVRVWLASPARRAWLGSRARVNFTTHAWAWRPTHGRVWLIGTRAESDSRARLVRVWVPEESSRACTFISLHGVYIFPSVSHSVSVLPNFLGPSKCHSKSKWEDNG
jgi:hypothetical protein